MLNRHETLQRLNAVAKLLQEADALLECELALGEDELNAASALVAGVTSAKFAVAALTARSHAVAAAKAAAAERRELQRLAALDETRKRRETLRVRRFQPAELPMWSATSEFPEVTLRDEQP